MIYTQEQLAKIRAVAEASRTPAEFADKLRALPEGGIPGVADLVENLNLIAEAGFNELWTNYGRELVQARVDNAWPPAGSAPAGGF